MIQWGFVAMVAGWAASFFFWNTALVQGPLSSVAEDVGDIAYYVGGGVALLAFLGLRKLPPLPELLGRRRKTAGSAASGDLASQPAEGGLA